MRSCTFFSNENEPIKAASNVVNKAKKKEMKPDLALIYSTKRYSGNYQDILKIIEKEFGNIPQTGGTIDGALFRGELRTDGVFLTLIEDKKARFRVKSFKYSKFNESGKDLIKELDIKEKDLAVIHSPIIYFRNRRDLFKTLAKAKYYDIRPKITKNNKDLIKGFSDHLYKKGNVRPPNKVLEKFSNQESTPVVNINLGHSNLGLDSPNVFSNYRNIKGDLSILLIEKNGSKPIYDDIYPSKTDDLKKNKEIVKKEIEPIKEIEIECIQNIITKINNQTVKDVVNEIDSSSKIEDQELKEDFEKGKVSSETPYILFLFNEETYGGTQIGIKNSFPFSLYPTYIDLSNFSKEAILGYEPSRGKLLKYISSINKVKDKNRFKLTSIDLSTVATFGEKLMKYRKHFEEKLEENYLAIFTYPPAAYLPENQQNQDYLTEVDREIFFSGGGTNLTFKI
ncbi:MAG: FIST-N domain containing protein [Candidatus Methanohalarchaeum thermophilum]|uniref:FIST-N domain containing protein n=1 Tax=Methanohalarchaeum thermophilum TaxID=1903181 RepID=A0A1Q6DX97_METT1|nr:MAG: FIST-N domain containing protein [Candidatus Methanohalarchaeum thermophilum]